MFKNIIPNYILDSKTLMQPRITAIATLAHTYHIELVSTVVLCAHMCALLFWCRRPSSSSSSSSSSPNKKPQTPDCDQVWCFGIQGVRTRGVGESKTRADENDSRCKNVCCDWVPGEEAVEGELEALGEGEEPDEEV